MAAEFIERRIQSNGNTVNFNIDRTQPFIDTVVDGKKARIFGTQEQLNEFQTKKPDGTTVSQTPAPVTIPKGVAKPGVFKDAIAKAINEIDFKTGIPQVDKSRTNSGSAFSFLPSVVPNPLEKFATMNSLWTMAVLTPGQFNNPQSYRSEGLKFAGMSEIITIERPPMHDFDDGKQKQKLKSGIIFSSGGRGDKYRVDTASGTPEFYVDDFQMKATVSANEKTGNTNAIGFSFTIYEPFSMGLLLQSLQVGAVKAGYINYLDAPYLLKLEFKGFDEDARQISSIKPKYFVMKLKTVKFEVDESGSKYQVEAFPYNHQGFSDIVDMSWNDISIAPDPNSKGTVQEILVTGQKSLQNLLNESEQLNVKQGLYSIPDEFYIEFPQDSSQFELYGPPTTRDEGATFDPNGPPPSKLGGERQLTRQNFTNNPIGDSDFGFTVRNGGNFPFAKEGDVYDKETGRILRDKFSIDPKNRVFQFAQSQKLTEIITQVILSSQYAKTAISDPSTLTPEGYIKWFRIDIQIGFKEYDSVIGDFAKIYTFRVVPFYVHCSIFGSASAPPPGYSELKKLIAKEYNYIFTGQNTDILKFEIKINNLFYTGTNPSAESKSKEYATQNQGGTVTNPPKSATTTNGTQQAKAVQASRVGKSKAKRSPSGFNLHAGGSGTATVEQRIAENFQQAFLSGGSADMISLDLEILGDPYWMVDSGISNYIAKASDKAQITDDGTANYEGSDVYIMINFRTPTDISEKKGTYEFEAASKASPFGGIYKVVKCESKFNQGQFTQTLRCLRMQGQALDLGGKDIPVDKNTALAKSVGEEKPPKNNVSAEQAPASDVFNWITDFANKFPAGPATSPKKESQPEIIERRRQSNGTLVNFNIDRTKPFVDTVDAAGNTLRIFES